MSTREPAHRGENFVPARLQGSSNDVKRQMGGYLIHAGPRDFFGVALCGVRPGKRSLGWAHCDEGAEVTCGPCRRLLERRKS